MQKKNILLFFSYLFFCQIYSTTSNEKVSQNTELPFVIVICSYNNAQWTIKNLDSVFTQEYTNFRVIYVDDCSQDETAQLVEQYIQEHNLQEKITFIKNDRHYGKLHNIYNAFHSCADHEIIAQLDGDDWLAHTKVLQLLNDIFSNNNVWFSYGQFMYSSGKLGSCKQITNNIKQKGHFRKRPWVTGHLKVFYAWLFKMVQLQHLLVYSIAGLKGQYYPIANDCATIFPMLEMSRNYIWFNPKVVYVFNTTNPLSAHNSNYTFQESCLKEIRRLPIYNPLTEPITERLAYFTDKKADCLLLSYSPTSLQTTLQSIAHFFHGIQSIVVVYQPENNQDALQYQKIQKQFPAIALYDISSNTQKIVRILKNLPSNYILCMYDTIKIDQPVYWNRWIIELERTFAYGVYGSLTSSYFQHNNIVYQHIKDNVYAWKFSCDRKKIINPNNFALTLYRKQDIMLTFPNKKYISLDDLIEDWHSIKIDRQKIGLFYD